MNFILLKKHNLSNAKDYENIRQVTGVMIARGASLTEDEFRKILGDNHFDIRLFSDVAERPKNETVEIPAQELPDLFAQLKLVNKSFDQCFFSGLQMSQPCAIDATESVERDESAGYPLQILNIDLQIQSRKIFTVPVLRMGSIWATKSPNILTAKETYLIPLATKRIAQPHPGDRFRTIYLIAQKNENDGSLRLTGLISLQRSCDPGSTKSSGKMVLQI